MLNESTLIGLGKWPWIISNYLIYSEANTQSEQ